MKAKVIFTALLILGASLLGFSEKGKALEGTSSTITVYAGEHAKELSTIWATAFNSKHSQTSILISPENIGLNKQLPQTENSLLIVHEGEVKNTQLESLPKMVIGREIVVPVISAKNPYLIEIMQQGIQTGVLRNAIEGNSKPAWGDLLGNASSQRINLYRSNEGATGSILNQFLNEEAVSKMTIVNGIEALLKQPSNDPSTIVFCRLSELCATSAATFPEGLVLMPFDFNQNGKLEQIENIYASPESFNRGVWIGKYPGELYQNLYAISLTPEYSTSQKEFMNWLISSGQSNLGAMGISPLASSEIAAKYSKINRELPQAGIPNAKSPVWPYLLALFSLIVVALVYFEITLRRSKIRKMNEEKGLMDSAAVFQLESLAMPKGVFYDKSHTWAFMEKDGMLRIGLDDFIQKITGPVSRILLKDEGTKILKGEPFCTLIVDGKKISLHSPVTGIIRSYNPRLIDQASLLYQSPFNEGWVYLIEPGNWAREMEFMRVAEKYRDWLKVEFTRFKDFIAGISTKNHFGAESIVLQDGGEMPANLLQKMGPEVWEDFQTQFIDQAK